MIILQVGNKNMSFVSKTFYSNDLDTAYIREYGLRSRMPGILNVANPNYPDP